MWARPQNIILSARARVGEQACMVESALATATRERLEQTPRRTQKQFSPTCLTLERPFQAGFPKGSGLFAAPPKGTLGSPPRDAREAFRCLELDVDVGEDGVCGGMYKATTVDDRSSVDTRVPALSDFDVGIAGAACSAWNPTASGPCTSRRRCSSPHRRPSTPARRGLLRRRLGQVDLRFPPAKQQT